MPAILQTNKVGRTGKWYLINFSKIHERGILKRRNVFEKCSLKKKYFITGKVKPSAWGWHKSLKIENKIYLIKKY